MHEEQSHGRAASSSAPRGTPQPHPRYTRYNHAAARRGTLRVTVHTQNRYVLINVWTWCCAEASLPPIRLIVLQSFCRAVVPRILFTCVYTPARGRASVDYATSADNQACRFTVCKASSAMFAISWFKARLFVNSSY